MPLAAGRLNKRLELWRSSPERRNSDGQVIEGPERIDTVWASIEPLSSRETFQQQQMQGAISHRITMRYRSDVTGKWWGVYGGRRFNFEPPTNTDEHGEEMIILATEAV